MAKFMVVGAKAHDYHYNDEAFARGPGTMGN
jgi:hypothetical protein